MKLITPTDPEWPLLFKAAQPVTDIVTQVRPFMSEMRALMVQHKGIAIAAPQVGIPLRFFLTDLECSDLHVCINPEIVRSSPNRVSALEGCLSWRGGEPRTYVDRPQWVDVRWTDQRGEVFTEHLYGLESRVFQHELDHLDGKTIFPAPAQCPTQLSVA